MYEIKKCKFCKLSKSIKDYIANQDGCYRCVFKIKKRQQKDIVSNKRTDCLICLKVLSPKRWRYCSDECLKISKKQFMKHWTQKFKDKGAAWGTFYF